MIDLPEHLEPLLSGHPHLDVLGSEDPWPIPDGWLEELQQNLRELAADPRAQTELTYGDYKPGTPFVVPMTWNNATYLPSAVPVWAGTEVHLGDTLIHPWLTTPYSPDGRRITYYSNTDYKWYLYLVWRLLDSDPVTRVGALELTQQCIAMFDDVPHHRQRGRTLTAMLQRVLDEPDLRRVHETGTWDNILDLWKGLATDAEAEQVPEVRGWDAQLAWSLSGLDAVHSHLSAVVSRGESADEVIASMALYNGVDELPAALAAATGGERFVRINDELDRRREGFDAPDWLGDNRGWLARGMVTGEIDAVRLWVAMATQVSQLTTALPDFVDSTTCPDRNGYVSDLHSIFQAPTKVSNPLAARLAERAARRREAERSAREEPVTGERLSAHGGRRRGGGAADPRGRDRRPDGRARRADRARAGQGAGPPPGGRAQGGEDPGRGRDAGLRPVPAHGLPRQPRYGEDHRGPTARPHLRPARGALQRSSRRGHPRRPGR